MRELRERLSQVPVLFISGYAEDAGASEPGLTLLRKPFTQLELAKAVREWLDRGGARSVLP